MCFQADYPLRADDRLMDDARREIEAVALVEGELFSELGQAKGDAAFYNVDDLVISMRMRGIDVVRPIRPGIGIQTFSGHDLPQRGFGWGR